MNAPTTGQWLRTAAIRVGVGSGRLGVHIGRRTVTYGRRRGASAKGWVGDSAGFDKGLRIGLLAGALLIARKIATAIARWAYHRIESGAWGPFLFAAAGVWIVAAYRCGRPGWEPKERPVKNASEVPEAEPESVEEEVAEEVPQPAPEEPPAVSLKKAPPVSPVALVAAVRDIGTPHAQLKPLAEHLGTTTDAVRAAAAGMAWAVKDVRMQGRSASAGLRWDEAPSPEEAYPSSASSVQVGAPDDDNDDGVLAVLVQDKQNPVRTHVVWRDQQP